VSRVESRFKQAWAHLERGFFARKACYVTRQNHAERISRRRHRRSTFLERLDFETFQCIAQPTLFFLEVFFGIDAALNREGTEIGRHVEICTCLDWPAEHQNRFPRRRRSDVLFRFAEF
jgi:hypothetical protein